VDISADFDCIHHLILTASLVPMVFVGSQHKLIPINAHHTSRHILSTLVEATEQWCPTRQKHCQG